MSRECAGVIAQPFVRQCCLFVALLAGASSVLAQQADSNMAADASSTVASAGGDTGKAPRKLWIVTPSLGLDLTHTDNVLLTPTGSSDFVTRLSPGIRIDGSSARAQGNLDFKLEKVSYADTEGKDRIQRSLNAAGTVELMERWLYVDASARISRQAISAFGPQSTGSYSANPNVVETKTYQIAPYIKGRAGNFADYTLRFDNTEFSSAGSTATKVNIQTVQADLAGTTSLTRLGWSLNANTQESNYAGGQKNQTESLRASLNYAIDPQFKVSLTGGQESNDYLNFNKQSSNITGVGFNWAPTERTRIDVSKEKRYFGNGHSFNLTHRMSQLSLRLSDKKDVMVLSPQLTAYSTGTYFDLLNTDSLWLARYPDDAMRAAAIRSFMQLIGLPADAQTIGTTQSPRASLTRTQEASLVLSGVLNTIALSVQRSERTSLSPAVGTVTDDFSLTPTLRQRGTNFNWAYRLSAVSTLTFMNTNSRSEGSASSNLSVKQGSNSLTLNSRLGAYTSGSVGVRRTTGSGSFNYVEHAIIGNVVMTF